MPASPPPRVPEVDADAVEGDAPAQFDAGHAEADESGDEELIQSDTESGPSEASDEGSEAAPAAAPAAARGRGRGRGKGAAKGGRAAGRGGGRGRGAGGAAAAGKQPKYKWVDESKHTFVARRAYAGEKLPKLSAKFDGLDLQSPISAWFEPFDLPDDKYTERAVNSNAYREWRALYKKDGTNQDGSGKRCYDGATPITYADMRTMDASELLNGLDPAVSREKVYAHDQMPERVTGRSCRGAHGSM